ncbi:hypothetical protein LPJ81_005611 [Coemansia sp. IMI 209127]|nr:hypothetical protein LPJ81_005611 [Coemansia sp. IMI 209127]
MPTTTITASTNAHGEADPIDGIVSIKSTAPTAAASRRATGAHTPFASSGWTAAAVVAAATAAGYIDPSSAQRQHQHHAPPAYVLPRDLNEARAPTQQIAAVLDTPSAPIESASPDTAATLPTQFTRGPTDLLLESPSASAFTPSQLPNSSFYKPLASICSPIRRASSSSAVNQQQMHLKDPADSASAPLTAMVSRAGLPLASLAEVNDALVAFADQRSGASSAHKRKASDGLYESVRPVAEYAEDVENAGSKRMRGSDSVVAAKAGIGMLVSPQTPHTAVATPTLALGAGAPMHDMHHTRLAALVGSDDDDNDNNDDDDGWLLAMDQLVDTEALMVDSPPPSPAIDFDAGTASDISENLPAAASSLESRSRRGASRGSDLFARWDRIPVNIFKRSRALASSSNRRDMIAHSDDMMGTVSSLALTAIKSSRQRRALVGSTLLTQHTLPAEPMGRHSAMRKGPRTTKHAGARRHASASVSGGSTLALLTQMPPPQPTPLSSRTSTQAADGLSRNGVAHSEGAAFFLRGSDSDGGLTRASSAIPSAKGSTAVGAPGSNSMDISPDDAATGGNAFAERMREHIRLVSGATANDASSDCAGAEDAYHHETDAGEGSDCGYAFGWLEDEEDLLLFADPDLESSGFRRPPNMTMVLASSSPMLVPYRTSGTAATRNGAASSSAPRHPH